MAGAETHIHAALIAHLETISLTPALNILYPGISDQDFDTSGEYARVTHLPNAPVRWGVSGRSPLDRSGFLVVDLFTPIHGGSWQILATSRADDIAAHFKRDLLVESAGFGVQIVQSEPGTGRKDPNGVHWHTPVNVAYRGTA